MAVVSSYGTLTAIANPTPDPVSISTSGPFYDGYRRTYAEIYRTQPAVRTVVDFFARNIAQLGLHAFRRVSETDRVRLTDHALPQLIRRPNPFTSRYRHTESTVQDIGIYANAYWVKVRAGRRLGLVRLPAAEMKVKGALFPTGYIWEPATGVEPTPFAVSEIVHFRMYDPANAAAGFPPIETLRRVLAEAAAAGDYREAFWKNAGRFETVITRPAGAPDWSRNPTLRNDFRKQWQEFAGKRAGQTPILEDGMEVKPISFNAKDSQYLESVKLTREVVAAEYHVPLPMVGILDHATFSNIREQHKQLYMDCLGPWLVMLEEDIELQLLPEFDDVDDVYVEFNIAEKMKGSFEEQADSLSRAVGRPYMTANEARARLNLPRHTNPTADDIAETSPGQGQSFRDPSPRQTPPFPDLVARFAARQQARLRKVPIEQRAEQFDQARWDRELAADLAPVVGVAAAERLAPMVNRVSLTLIERGNDPWWDAARVDAVSSWLSQEAARV